jgi:beta-1,3-galactosyltransferase 5
MYATGMSPNVTVNNLLKEEHLIYKDILQIGSFNDSYSLGTLKLMKIYKWIATHCANSIYMLKINDDVIMNTFKLVEYFKRMAAFKSTKQIFGLEMNGSPVRDVNNKFFLTQDQYGSFKFPSYPDGNFEKKKEAIKYKCS